MQQVQFFPLDGTYKIVNGKPVIHLFGKTRDGSHVIIQDHDFEPYFYAIPQQSLDGKGANAKEKLSKLRIEGEDSVYFVARTESVNKKFLGKKIDAIKVFTNIPAAVPEIRNIVKDWDIIHSTYEFDIPYVRRYFIDKKITPLVLHQAECEQIESKSRVKSYKAGKIEQAGSETLSNPKILAFDIETYSPFDMQIDMEKNPIIMLSVYGENFKKLIVWKQFEHDAGFIDFVDSESELLQKFKDIVLDYEPDILTGYFSDGFDLPYVRKRADINKVKLDFGWDYSDIRVKSGSETTASINGITHLDIFKFIKRTMGASLDTYTYDLNAVASELLEEQKVDVALSELTNIWDNDNGKLLKYAEYCAHDSYLTYNLAMKMLPVLIEMVKIVGIPVYDVNRVGFSQLVEWYTIKQAQSFNEIVPNKPGNSDVTKRRADTYQGAFVFEPKPGFFRDIVVFDFRSLYPTILTSHNIGSDTLNCECCMDSAKKIPGEEYWFCTKKRGFIPILVEDLINRRIKIKEVIRKEEEDKKKFLDARQNSLKLLANSFYGYLGFFAARWYCIECARSITALGRFYIQNVIDSAQKEGFDVLYSDTDSIFLALVSKTKDDARDFVKRINMELPGLMELDYENFYPSGIFVSAKVGPFGAKKKYALLSEQGTMKIRGFEMVRRNWSLIAKNTQETVLDIILREHDTKKAMSFVKEIIKDLRSKKMPKEMVIIHTQLQKEIVDYAAKGPHVAVAQRMRQKGRNIGPGSMIKYIVTQGADNVRDRAKLPEEVKDGEYDADYYVNSQVVPAVERIFNVLGYTKEDLLEQASQKKLAGFF